LSLSDNQQGWPATIKKKQRKTKPLRSERITTIITSLPAAASHPERRYVLIQIVALQRIVFHGLRKNAVIMLLEVGCTEDEVGAIVGMSPAMVRHYAKEVRRHHLAINAMKKLEIGWSEIRKSVFGSAKKSSAVACENRNRTGIGNQWRRIGNRVWAGATADCTCG
jgi:hypothetical protein